MKLSRLLQEAGLENSPVPALAGDPEIAGVADDSRKVRPGWLFVAVRGTQLDGHAFVPRAIEAGAAAVVASMPPPESPAVPWIVAPDSQRAVGPLAHAFAGWPGESILVAGVTGTNGKTTVAWLLESIFRAAGKKTALLGTLGYCIGNQRFEAPTTTASACRNAELFAKMREGGIQAAALEVSSHAIDQGRVEGIRFRAGILTNITQDHLDYHKTMEGYAGAKRRFFEETITSARDAVAVFNLDDSRVGEIARDYPGEQIGFGTHPEAVVRRIDATVGLKGIQMRIQAGAGARDIRSTLLGWFNVENILAAAAGGLAMGFDWDAIVNGIQAAANVPGRLERIDEGQPFLVAVDYAHTPDALERVLENARELTTGRLIAVFGCGGDRDPLKRPKMGAAVGKAADFGILTNDNPRTEDPERIAAMAEEGLRGAAPSPDRYAVCLDRRQAIVEAIGMARQGDFVLIAGKGHEPYQEIDGVRHHFDDREEAREALKALG